MDVRRMREALRSYYGSGSPFSKRLDKMPDNQVIAIYYRLKEKGVLK
jgi:hypothetical protein